MIVKGVSTVVNFYATDASGQPADDLLDNTLAIRLLQNGDTGTNIRSSVDVRANPSLNGWYRFSYTFNTAGNVFIAFSASGYVIAPWEDTVVDLPSSSGPTANDVAMAVWGPNGYTILDTWLQAGQNTPLKSIVPAVWANPTRTITSSPSDLTDVLNAIKAGILNWQVANNTLTLYNDSGTSLGTYTLTRDTAGNIIRVEPNS